jgi:hypothetical protein
MRHLRRLALTLLVLAASASAQDIALTANPIKAVLSAAEPIQVKLEIRNASKSNMLIGRTFALNYFVAMDITGPNGPAAWCGTIPSRADAPYTILRPGARISRVVAISCRNGSGYDMREAGSYQVRASYSMPTPIRPLREAVASDVRIPKGPIYADAFTVTVK